MALGVQELATCVLQPYEATLQQRLRFLQHRLAWASELNPRPIKAAHKPAITSVFRLIACLPSLKLQGMPANSVARRRQSHSTKACVHFRSALSHLGRNKDVQHHWHFTCRKCCECMKRIRNCACKHVAIYGLPSFIQFSSRVEMRVGSSIEFDLLTTEQMQCLRFNNNGCSIGIRIEEGGPTSRQSRHRYKVPMAGTAIAEDKCIDWSPLMTETANAFQCFDAQSRMVHSSWISFPH